MPAARLSCLIRVRADTHCANARRFASSFGGTCYWKTTPLYSCEARDPFFQRFCSCDSPAAAAATAAAAEAEAATAAVAAQGTGSEL